MPRTFEDPALGGFRDKGLLAARGGSSGTANLRRTEAYQVSRPAPHALPARFQAPAGQPAGVWLMDLVFLLDFAGVNDRAGYVVVLVNANSRYVYAAPSTRKDGKRLAAAVAAMLDDAADDAAAGLRSPVEAIVVDTGSEWFGEVGALLDARGVAVRRADPATHSLLSRLDRWVGTFRGQLRALFAATSGNEWRPFLPQLLLSYNTRPHSALRAVPALKKVGAISPESVPPELEHAIVLHDLALGRAARRAVDALGIAAGDRVRVFLFRGSDGVVTGVKSETPSWSRAVYRVVRRAGVNRFLLDGAPSGYARTQGLGSLQFLPAGSVLASTAAPTRVAARAAQRLRAALAREIDLPEEEAAPAPVQRRAPRVAAVPVPAVARSSGRTAARPSRFT